MKRILENVITRLMKQIDSGNFSASEAAHLKEATQMLADLPPEEATGCHTQWREAILGLLKTFPEFESLEWGGDKEGWVFCFELIKYLAGNHGTLYAKLNSYCVVTNRMQFIVRAPSRPSDDTIRRKLFLAPNEPVTVRKINIVTWEKV